MERVADYVIKRLIECEIKHIFMVTGRGILYLSDAVAKNPEIEGISTYHEQGASYAAMAYASANDGMSACLVSTGCAATNAVTAALCAFQDNLPVVFISGQNMLNETTRHMRVPIRTYGSQEADIIKVVESITKYAVMIEEPKDIAYEMDKAIYYANNGRKGPVWIDIPLDVQNSRINPKELKRFTPHNNDDKFKLNEKEIEATIKYLNYAKRPIIFVGGGLRASGVLSEFREFVERINIPVVYSTSAADAYGSGMKQSIGAVGSLGGSRAGNMAVQNADFILAIGTMLS
ncbi:MAG: thiamine pyrophosphate-binding protein, partial [Acetivibrio ethanolgignens]